MGIQLKKSKCVFLQPSVKYFAFVVDRQGIHTSPRKVQAIREVSVPENSTDLTSFLGLVNYYRKFIPDMATSVNHVNRSLSQDIPWSWSDDCQKSFETLKAALENSPLLTHYDSKKQEACYLMYRCTVFDDGEEQPIACASRTLSTHRTLPQFSSEIGITHRR
jgi:hypothetical protein